MKGDQRVFDQFALGAVEASVLQNVVQGLIVISGQSVRDADPQRRFPGSLQHLLGRNRRRVGIKLPLHGRAVEKRGRLNDARREQLA